MPNKTNDKKEPIRINLKHILLVIMIILALVVLYICSYYKKVKELENKTVEEVTPITTFNQDEAVKLIGQYLEEKSLAQSEPTALLERYNLATSNEISSFEKTQDGKYYKTSILYGEIKKILTKYITPQYFLEEFKDVYNDMNGIVYISTNKKEKEYYQISRSEHVSSTSTKECITIWYFLTQNDKTSEEKNMQVEFTKTNGVWLISNIK